MNIKKIGIEDKMSKSAKLDNEKISLYDEFGALAYGVILQIIPKEKQAQEVLIQLFSGNILQKCKECFSSKVACVIKCARELSIAFKKQLDAIQSVKNHSINTAEVEMPAVIFDLSFRQNFSLEEIAKKLSISKEMVLKHLRDYMKSYR